MDLTIAMQLAISLALGMIIGMERGWKTRKSPQGIGGGGIRSFGLVGLLGAIATLLANRWGIALLGVIFLGLAGLIATSYVLTARHSQDYGTTTELSLLITFTLGALVVSGYTLEAIAIAVITTWLLGLKQEFHQYLQLLKREELIATLQLLLIAAVVLPLLPSNNIGPWQAINPRSLGLLVLLIAFISYVGYFATRLLGDRVGLTVTGFLGGLASSTATAVAFARMERQQRGETVSLATGISLAAGTMAPRLLIVIAVVNPALGSQLAFPLLTLGLVSIVAAVAIARWANLTQSSVALEVANPIELRAAIQYAILLAVLSIMVRGAQEWLGNAGIYLVSAVSGLADVDAVSISLARAALTNLSQQVAITGIGIAVFMNTLVKVILARIIGSAKLAYWCGAIMFSALGISWLTILIRQ